MEPLAKLWTRAGHSFIPIAIGWAVFARGGLDGTSTSTGVLITRGYWGLLVTLWAASLLVWIFGLYVREARQAGEAILAPPNTAFETRSSRNLLISWGTVTVFTLVIIISLAAFGSRYADSSVYGWDQAHPLHAGFVESRAAAFAMGCAHQPCFSMSLRFDGAGQPLSGVVEYILYVTDGLLLVPAAAVLLGLAYSLAGVVRRRPLRRIEL